ncbi:hypothetical protein L6164_013339 [Bauhinia variegata]|uniref:Uncharacterized protein n=1 Tax=Bauhinia variegata TaxID=167791 RepID=A0ACB9PCS1_BAUVA|nr:hypothetical protein L6164_013339 [Bauhinia variegata]
MNQDSPTEKQALKASISVSSSNSRDRGRGRDTGYGNHMSGSKFSFSSLNQEFQSNVSFGDCSSMKVMAKCDIKIKNKNGFVETIFDVLYVLDLKSNLLSANQLQEKGYVITIKQGVCEIYDPVRGAIAVVQISSNRLFLLKIETVQRSLWLDG